MKTILEFGVKGGAHIDNAVIPSIKLGAQLAAAMVCAFTNDSASSRPKQWFAGTASREWWENDTHFVALTKMDGILRGAASAHLWRKR